MSYRLNSKNFKVKYVLNSRILSLCQEIIEQLGDLKDIQNLHFYPQIRKRSRVESIHSTCKIENNSLTIEQVTDIIDSKRVKGPENEIQEIKNANEAYNLFDKIDPFEFDSLLYVHSVMSNKIVDKPGKLRTNDVYIRSNKQIVYKPPIASEVPDLINQLFYWIKNDEAPLIIKSCVFHFYLECIHPFDDCNGRMGRYWQLAILNKYNPLFKYIPIEKIIVSKQDEYYKTFETEKNDYDCTNFIEFMLEAILDQILDLISQTKVERPSYSSNVDCMLKLMVNEFSYSAEELMKILKVKTRNWLLVSYLQPALKLGLIEMTIPDKPTSKNQRYRKVRF